MFAHSSDSPVPLRFLDAGSSCAASSPLEEEVVGLFVEFRRPLLRYLLSFGLTPDDAEEIVQEVFLALFQHLLRGKSRSNLRGWVFRVGHNLALKQRKRNSQRSALHCREDFAENHRCPRPGPEELLETAQTQARLLAAVQALPEQDRCCLNLRAEGLRYREIAAVLGISLGGVALSLSRSLRRLANAERS